MIYLHVFFLIDFYWFDIVQPNACADELKSVMNFS